MSWRDGTLVSFDTETTGVDPEEARIVTASVVVIQPGQKPQVFEWLIDPGIEIPEEAAAVHGVTTEHAREFGEHPTLVLPQITASIHDACRDGAPLIVYNAPYDLTVLDREMRRHFYDGYSVYPDFAPIPIVDPLVIDRALDKYRKGKRTLTATSAHYRVPISDLDAHGSTADALCAARVAWKLAGLFPAQLDDLTALQARQARWHREWADHLGQYLKTQGKPDDVGRDWPMCTAAQPARSA